VRRDAARLSEVVTAGRVKKGGFQCDKTKIASGKDRQHVLRTEPGGMVCPAGVRGMESLVSLCWERETPSAEAQPFS